MIERSSLVLLSELGRGGFGVVYRTRAVIDGQDPVEVAYKELLPAKKGREADVAWNRRSIQESVAFRKKLTEADREQLDGLAVWPLELVRDEGVVTGYVMRLIEPEFSLKTKDGSVLATLGWMAAKGSTLEASGIKELGFREFSVRLTLMRQLAYGVAWLHARKRVFGDLSLSNGAFVASPTRFLLMDCDATGRWNDPRRRQAHSPFFDPPEDGNLQTWQSDVYKLALCVVRSLSHGRGATQVRSTKKLQEPLPAQLLQLLDRALSKTPAERPEAIEIWRALGSHIDRTYPPPTILSATSTPTGAVLRGQDVIVRWKTKDAQKVTLIGPDGTKVDSSLEEGLAAIRIDCAGELRLRASNAHGHAETVVGEIHVYEFSAPTVRQVKAPRIDLPQGWRPEIRLPRTQIPTLPGGIRPVIAQNPIARAQIHAELAELTRSVDGLRDSVAQGSQARNGDLRAVLADGARAYRQATAQMIKAISADSRNHSAAFRQAEAPAPAADQKSEHGEH